MIALSPCDGAGMVKRYHGSFPSFSYGFDSRYPLHDQPTSSGFALSQGTQAVYGYSSFDDSFLVKSSAAREAQAS